MAKEKPVKRPTKRSEFTIIIASREAEKGWQDLKATHRNALADTWDFLTKTPLNTTPKNYPLKGKLKEVSRGGVTYERWQHKPTLGGGARIWFYVKGQKVYLEQVHTSHPNQTK